MRGGYRRLGYLYGPYAVLAQLDELGVGYILVGSLARVLVGADEIPEGFDLVIPKGARDPTDQAILSFALRAPPAVDCDGNAWIDLLVSRGADQGAAGARGNPRPPRPAPPG